MAVKKSYFYSEAKIEDLAELKYKNLAKAKIKDFLPSVQFPQVK